jgi:superfamily I DNA/RNA helicase
MPGGITHLIKTRALLGQLDAHGLSASRATRTGVAKDGPDALLAAKDGRAWLVVLWGGSSLQPSLIREDESKPSLHEAVDAMLAWCALKVADAGFPAPSLLILAPALDSAELPGGVWRHRDEKITVITARACKKAALLAQSILRGSGVVLSADSLARWRSAAVPESVIDSPWKRKGPKRAAADSTSPLLLDYKQERCARLDLEPDPEAAPLVRDLRLRLITGVAGCGKTLVLVHRAALLATHFPKARVLLVSFNRPLINDLRRRLRRMKTENRVECLTFNQWLHRVAPFEGEIMPEPEVLRWIERERQPFTSLVKLSAEWLRDELRWMCDHALADEAYLTAARKGRGTRLSTHQRRDLLTLLHRFRANLREQTLADWSEWPLRVRETPPPSLSREGFDHLLIDEAQFFAPVWLELLRGALKPGGHLFLCADPTQGFLKRRQSWSEVGLDVRNRSVRLERPYRSTRAILEFARDFYHRRLPDDDEPLNLPAPEWLETLEPGVPPLLCPGGPPQDQLANLENDVRSLLGQVTAPGHILVLVAGRRLHAKTVVQHLNTRLGAETAALAKDDHAEPESITVAHLMAATGLERPIIFLLGIDDLLAEENNPLLTAEEAAELRQTITRQIYVGITRGMERVVIYADGMNALD